MLRYRTLNSLAMRLLPPEGGLLMTCSCSGAVAQSSGHFLGMLRVSGALQAATTVQLVLTLYAIPVPQALKPEPQSAGGSHGSGAPNLGRQGCRRCS